MNIAQYLKKLWLLMSIFHEIDSFWLWLYVWLYKSGLIWSTLCEIHLSPMYQLRPKFEIWVRASPWDWLRFETFHEIGLWFKPSSGSVIVTWMINIMTVPYHLALFTMAYKRVLELLIRGHLYYISTSCCTYDCPRITPAHMVWS